MGLSSKQVSSDRHGWNQALLQANTLELPKPASMKRQSSQVQQQEQEQQQPQQEAEHLKCPRCESSNTKFCYYNNYNRSQPRHFCKACKRHWTKGGTLRNVPVGGGRKNKRVKTSNSGTKAASKTITCTTTTTTTPTGNNTNDNIKALLQQQQQQSSRFSLPLGVGAISSLGGFDDKNFTHEFYQTLVRQPPPPATNTTSSAAALPETSITFNTTKGLNNGIFLGAKHDNHHDHHNNDDLQFPYSNLGSFESDNPCSISSSNFYNLASDHHHHHHQPNNGLEETVMNSLSSSSLSDHHHQTWNATTPTTAATATTTTTPTTANSVMMDISSNWGWDDFDKFVTVDADLTMPWDDDDDDADIKPSAGPL